SPRWDRCGSTGVWPRPPSSTAKTPRRRGTSSSLTSPPRSAEHDPSNRSRRPDPAGGTSVNGSGAGRRRGGRAPHLSPPSTPAPESCEPMAQTSTPPRARTRAALPTGPGSIRTLLLKIVLLGFIDAVAVFAAFMLALQDNWLAAIIVLAVTALVNWVYFSRRL